MRRRRRPQGVFNPFERENETPPEPGSPRREAHSREETIDRRRPPPAPAALGRPPRSQGGGPRGNQGLPRDSEPKASDGHISFLPARNSTIFSGALPSFSIFSASPRAGGSASASTFVREPASPTLSASRPRSPADTVSCGFFLAPMIPF